MSLCLQKLKQFFVRKKKKKLFTGLGSVRIVKNCDLGLENAALGLRPRAAFSRPRSQFFTIRTSQPANNIYIWDVSKALDYLKTLPPVEKLTLKELTLKTVMLLLLVTGQRGHFISLLSLNGIQMLPNTAYLSLDEHTKTSRPNKTTTPVTITEFTPDNRICPLATLKTYISVKEKLRNGENKLFFSFIRPYKAVSRDTISRWVKQVLKNAGIYTQIFTSHSTRAAVASKAEQKEVSLDIILDTIGWASANCWGCVRALKSHGISMPPVM